MRLGIGPLGRIAAIGKHWDRQAYYDMPEMDMPETPVALTVPRRCAACRTLGTVRVQPLIKGHRMLLQWCCIHCEAEWLGAPLRK